MNFRQMILLPTERDLQLQGARSGALAPHPQPLVSALALWARAWQGLSSTARVVSPRQHPPLLTTPTEGRQDSCLPACPSASPLAPASVSQLCQQQEEAGAVSYRSDSSAAGSRGFPCPQCSQWITGVSRAVLGTGSSAMGCGSQDVGTGLLLLRGHRFPVPSPPLPCLPESRVCHAAGEVLRLLQLSLSFLPLDFLYPFPQFPVNSKINRLYVS